MTERVCRKVLLFIVSLVLSAYGLTAQQTLRSLSEEVMKELRDPGSLLPGAHL